MKTLTKTIFATAVCLTLFSASAIACPGQKGSDGMGHGSDHKMHLVRKVVHAVSQTGLSAEQAQAVTDAVNAFKAKRMELKASKTFPVDAFGDDAFDAKAFKREKQKRFDAKIGAVTELFEQIYAVLTPEQRPIFRRAFTAPMVEKMIKKNMIKGASMHGGMKCGGSAR